MSARIASGASSRRSPRHSPRLAQSFGSFPLPGIPHRSFEDRSRYSRQNHLSASTATPAARHRFEHFGMLVDYFLLLFRGKKKDAAPFILITKGRENPATNPKIRVTHVSSLDCFRKTERDFSELCVSHLSSFAPTRLLTRSTLHPCAISSLNITELYE